jgi:hypothetical protein
MAHHCADSGMNAPGRSPESTSPDPNPVHSASQHSPLSLRGMSPLDADTDFNPYTWWLRGWQACAHYNEEWQDDAETIAREWALVSATLSGPISDSDQETEVAR